MLGRWTKDLDLAESIGVQGLIGLGAIGLLTLFVGLVPGGLKWGLGVIGLVAAAGYIPVFQAFSSGKLKFEKPQGTNVLLALALGVAGIMSLVSVLAPSVTLLFAAPLNALIA